MPPLEDEELKERVTQICSRRGRDDEREEVEKLISVLTGSEEGHGLMRASFLMAAEYLREALVDHQVTIKRGNMANDSNFYIFYI